MAETSLGILMKEIGEALHLDNDSFDKEAYVKYISCIHSIAGNLVLGVNLSGGNVVIGAKTVRHVKLLQQCVERVVALISRMAQTHHPDASSPVSPSYVSPQTTPVASGTPQVKDDMSFPEKIPNTEPGMQPQASSQGDLRGDARGVALHSQVPALPSENNPYHYERQKTLTPMEIARRQNQSLLTVYKARMKRLNKSDFNAFNYSLTIQRKMAENLAIAQAQEVELARKMKARQQRLEEEAARRFHLPTGMSPEEQEQRQMYKNILMYENEVENLQKWRQKMESSGEDPIVICQLVQEVLRCRDHPLTTMLRTFQFKVYERAYPLVANRQRLLDMVNVGLPKHLWPSREDVLNLLESTERATSPLAPEVRKKKKSRNRGGKSESDKTNVEGGTNSNADVENASREEVGSPDLNKEENADMTIIGPIEAHKKEGSCDHPNTMEKDFTKCSDGESHNEKNNVPRDVPSSIEDASSQKEEDGVGTETAADGRVPIVPDTCRSDGEEEEKTVTGSERRDVEKEENGEADEKTRTIDDEDDGSDTSTLTSVSDSDSDCEDLKKDDNGIGTLEEDTKYDLETAMKKGNQLESELTFQRKQAQLLMKQVAKDYESYNDEDFDDLFDEEEEEEEEEEDEEEEVTVRAGSISEKSPNKLANTSREPSPASRPKTLEKKPGRSLSMQPVHVDTPTEPPSSMFQSLPFMPVTDGGSSEEEEDQKELFNLMNLEAYSRHLKAIAEDVHTFLDKLLAIMIVAYESLDTPVGRDQCSVSLEEPFFKPIWKTLHRLFRVVHHKQELVLACVMTKYADASPKDFQISKKFWLVDESDQNPSYEPYQPAIEELRRLSEHYTILSKLECLVKVCRLICECVDKYYAEKDSDATRKSPKKVPTLGADDLLPVFTYVIIRTKSPQIVSECFAMMEFIQESYMMGEEGYCLTTLRTAIAYATTLYTELCC